MKLVTLYVDPADANEANSRLREAGVMTQISMVDPHNIKPSKSGAVRFGLSVVFDDQLDDAVELLGNPHHVPKRKISLAEMNEIESAGNKGLLKARTGLPQTAAILIFVACLLFIGYIAIRYFG